MAGFEGKIAVVTGGAGDIGATAAKHLASLGARLAVVDIKSDKATAVAKEIAGAGGEAEAFACDVTDEASVIAMRDAVVERFGRIDYLFNNAGYQGLFTQIDKYPSDDFQAVINVNVVGVFHVLKACSQQMIAQAESGSGAIVNTASMAGVRCPPNMIGYTASKAAVVGITVNAALDLAPYSIRVNAISPAFMGPGMMWDRQVELQAQAGSQYYDADPKVVAEQMVGQVPLRRVGSMEEIAQVVAFLLSDQASYLTGVNVPISGGIV
jgi:NAD(P)-dependent dehydrogenase (short-subunit alcohol dehydrogenase family)